MKYFSDLLKKTYGKNFSGLLLDLKMAYAAELLANTDTVYGMKSLEYRKSRNV